MMKKLVLKYLPLPIALVLALCCVLTLFDYNNNSSQYAVVSFQSQLCSADIYVSKTGRILNVVPSDQESNENFSELSLVKSNISDALTVLMSFVGDDETAMLGVYANEETPYEVEILKSILDKASLGITKSCLCTYGTYSAYELERAIKNNFPIVRISYTTAVADTVLAMTGEYLDSYSMLRTDPYEIYRYAEYSAKLAGVPENEIGLRFSSDFSKIIHKDFNISESEALGIALGFLSDIYGDSIPTLSEMYFRFDDGHICYAYNYDYDGDDHVVVVNAADGRTSDHYYDEF